MFVLGPQNADTLKVTKLTVIVGGNHCVGTIELRHPQSDTSAGTTDLKVPKLMLVNVGGLSMK